MSIFNHNLYFQELEQIVNMDSPSNYPEGSAQVAGFFRERFEEMGWHDSLIRSFAFDDENWRLLLDLDYIFKWVHPAEEGG